MILLNKELIAEEYKIDLILNKTKEEQMFCELLDRNNIKYEFQHIIYTYENFYIVDFFIPMCKKIIEIDGGYHITDEQKKLDNIRTNELTRIGYTIKRLTNNEVVELGDNVILSKICVMRVEKKKKSKYSLSKKQFAAKMKQKERILKEENLYDIIKMNNGDYKKVEKPKQFMSREEINKLKLLKYGK